MMAPYRHESMEMACTSPGVWRIEGYDVERLRADGKVWWLVYSRRAVQVRADEPYSIHETFHGKRPTLTEACDFIWDLLIEDGRAS